MVVCLAKPNLEWVMPFKNDWIKISVRIKSFVNGQYELKQAFL